MFVLLIQKDSDLNLAPGSPVMAKQLYPDEYLWKVANMLANIWHNIVGQFVGAVCYRHQHVAEEKKRRKMLDNIY